MLTPDTKLVLSPGEQVELLLEFQESEVVELTDLAREPLVTCAVEEECSLQPRPGEGGTERSMSPKRDTPCALLLLPPESQLSSWPRVTLSMVLARSHLLFQTRSRASRRPRMLWFS